MNEWDKVQYCGSLRAVVEVAVVFSTHFLVLYALTVILYFNYLLTTDRMQNRDENSKSRMHFLCVASATAAAGVKLVLLRILEEL